MMKTQAHYCPSMWKLSAAMFIGFVLFLAVGRVQAGTPAQDFYGANALFAAGNYHAAITEYESILARDGYSPAVLFNLGNAYYRDGQLGAAILNFERAQVLAPRDANIEANLIVARQKAGVPSPRGSAWERWSRTVSPNTLAWTGEIALVAICLLIGMSRLRVRVSYVKVMIATAGVILAGVVIAFAMRWPEFDRAIVISPTAAARIAPANTAAAPFTLKAGETVTIDKAYGQFALVRASDGRAGWMSDKDFGRVFPTCSTSGKQSGT
jgi:tetratricopeptide (TPR) repeat protein